MEAYAESNSCNTKVEIELEKRDHTCWRGFSTPSGLVLGKRRWYAVHRLQIKISIFPEYQMAPDLSKDGPMSLWVDASHVVLCRVIVPCSSKMYSDFTVDE